MMMKASRPLLRSVLCVALLGSVIATPRLAYAADTAGKQAREAFNEGQAAFNLGQFDKAIEAWQRGYKIKQDPVFLYNIAQAYRKLDNAEQAIFFYKSFLHNTSNAPNRDEVVGWIDQLERQLSQERQKKAEEERLKAEAEQRRRQEEEQQRQTAVTAARAPVERPLRGDIGLGAGVSIWVAGLSPSRSPSAALELSGGYTLVERGRLRFRLGATVGYTYLRDVNDKAAHFIGLLVDPTLKVDLWRKKIFFFVEVGLGAVVITGIPRNQPSALLAAGKGTDGGAFAAFEARPAVGVEYVPIRRLGIWLAPGAAISTPPTHDFSTLVRVQILAGLSIKL